MIAVRAAQRDCPKEQSLSQHAGRTGCVGTSGGAAATQVLLPTRPPSTRRGQPLCVRLQDAADCHDAPVAPPAEWSLRGVASSGSGLGRGARKRVAAPACCTAVGTASAAGFGAAVSMQTLPRRRTPVLAFLGQCHAGEMMAPGGYPPIAGRSSFEQAYQPGNGSRPMQQLGRSQFCPTLLLLPAAAIGGDHHVWLRAGLEISGYDSDVSVTARESMVPYY